jgi:hypothetical protein
MSTAKCIIVVLCVLVHQDMRGSQNGILSSTNNVFELAALITIVPPFALVAYWVKTTTTVLILGEKLKRNCSQTKHLAISDSPCEEAA